LLKLQNNAIPMRICMYLVLVMIFINKYLVNYQCANYNKVLAR
jgi:hypothetical protein